MTYCCNGICSIFRSTKVTMAKKYQNGQKRCTLCDVFFKTESNRCPCCNIKLRTKSRNYKSKKKRIQNTITLNN